jgi:hypothetical protein
MGAPAVVFPFHDPDGVIFPHLIRITPLLSELFSRAFVSLTSTTIQKTPEVVTFLNRERFFNVLPIAAGTLVGDHFKLLYQNAVAASDPSQLLHLCFIDRLAFILQSQHKTQFLKDIQAIGRENTPFLFSRSKIAWDTHPRNYFEIENFATRSGEFLFGKTLDFAWCHLVIQAGFLKEILPKIQNHDISMLAEIVLPIREKILVKGVDWLEWEDPFLLSCDGIALKTERENSPLETQKRLAYIVPILQTLVGKYDL